MTHPGGGAGGTGPGRILSALSLTALRLAAAAQAGARSTAPAPMSAERRTDNYRQQNGTWAGGRLTPRQRRRAAHKANRRAATA